MANSRLTETLESQRHELFAEWIKEQNASLTTRGDLLSEGELRADSDRFLTLFAIASKSSNFRDVSSSEFKPLLDMLGELSRSRGRLGFSPTETATFVFSFKQPLFAALQKAHGEDGAGFADDMWAATVVLDRLGLYTTETHQQAREDVIRRQQEEMLELSTPVVQLWEGIVALPLIGTLDSARTSVVMETLLQTIVQTRSEIAIIDITGVPTVDTLVAQHLLKTVAAARLMGADCIISGIRPQIAQTMVHLQIDLSTVTTKATMAEALRTAIKRGGFEVGRQGRQAGSR